MSVFSTLRTGTHVIELDEPLALVGEAMEPPVNWNMFKMQYHGTWSHSDHPNRKSPEDMPKHEFGELLLRLVRGLSLGSLSEEMRGIVFCILFQCLRAAFAV